MNEEISVNGSGWVIDAELNKKGLVSCISDMKNL